MVVTLAQIVANLGGELHGAAFTEVDAIAPLERAGARDIAFLSGARYQHLLQNSRAACVIVGTAMQETARARGACIVTSDPYLYYARLTQWWVQCDRPTRQRGIHPSAVVDASARVDPSAVIGPLCVVEREAEIGPDTVLTSRVTVGYGCRVGARCLIHSGVVIGADGFGFAPHEGHWVKIEQLGAVRIGDDVEIGANTCIDRGALCDTVVEDGVKLDNLIQIGHNVHIGRDSALAGCVGVAGSAVIGERCTLGGQAGVLGHLELAPDVHVSAGSMVTRSLREPGRYTGLYPLDRHDDWERSAALLRRLDALRDRVRELERRLPRDET